MTLYIHVWEVDEQPAVNEIFEKTPQQILVNGELIVHRDDIIRTRYSCNT